ncbi:CvpA family protein [Limibacter armeniacum]|uniref:CvpA family protein n=1 Tax=Limibacter armeniacum TaxID=466084 RepID=UPI002FE5DF16
MVTLEVTTGYISIVDIFLGGSIVYGAYKGFKRGFLLEVISTAVFLVGVFIVFMGVVALSTNTQELLGIQTPKSTVFFLFLLFYIVGTIALNLVGRKLQEWVDYSVLDDLDNVAALITGGFKYAISLSIILGLFNSAGLGPSKATIDNYMIYPVLLDLHGWLVDTGAMLAPTIGEKAEHIHNLFDQHISN